jgi:hypothetical protein
MPNHVYNSVNFTGSDKDLSIIQKKLSMPRPGDTESNYFNFENLIAPSDLDWYTEDANWYDWNIANWGTKWNAYDVNMVDPWEEDQPLHYNFTTAWSPPEPVMLLLVEFMVSRKLDVTMTWYYEEEQGWGAEYLYTLAGGLKLVEEWDIPSTHEEYTRRGGECYCMQGEAAIYDDCPVGEL